MKRPHPADQRGQTLIEFALSLTVFIVLLFGIIQLAIIGNSALAVSQLAYAGVRYAAINPSKSSDLIISYMKSIAPVTIAENNCADLSISLSPSVAPRTFGTTVSVSITYSLSNKLLLPSPFLGISFPTSLTNIQNTMMSE
jgi:Flp pilus assembly protein TadG